MRLRNPRSASHRMRRRITLGGLAALLLAIEPVEEVLDRMLRHGGGLAGDPGGDFLAAWRGQQ